MKVAEKNQCILANCTSQVKCTNTVRTKYSVPSLLYLQKRKKNTWILASPAANIKQLLLHLTKSRGEQFSSVVKPNHRRARNLFDKQKLQNKFWQSCEKNHSNRMKIIQNVIVIKGHKNASSDKRSNAMDKILPLKKPKPVLKKK